MVTMTQSELADFLEQVKVDLNHEMQKELKASLAHNEAKVEESEAAPKGFKLEHEKFGMWVIKYEGGGQVPVILQGAFTEEKIANRAIEAYLVKRDKGDKQDVKSFAA